MKKIICLGVMLVMAFSFGACGKKSDIAIDCVSVLIKAEFEEKFKAEEFTAEDFEWDNAERIVYHIWYEKNSKGWMTVYLKEHGKKQALAAVEHFNTLDFVDIAETISIMHMI